MQIVNRIIKALVGGVVGFFAPAVIVLPLAFSVFELKEPNATYVLILRASQLVAVIVGAVFLSKAKWSAIFATVLVVFVLLMCVYLKYKGI